MKLILFFTFLLFSTFIYGQDSCKYYFDKYNIVSTVDSFDVFRIVKHDNKKAFKVYVTEYFRNGTLKLIGEYSKIEKSKITDLSEFSIYSVNESYWKDGVFKEWDENGKFISEMTFKKGEQYGKVIYGEENVFLSVEKMASFKGAGFDSVRSYVAHNLVYPSEAYNKKIKGKVVIGFCVNSKGYVCDVKVLKNVHPLLDKAAVEIIESMPKWEPGMYKKTAVKQKFAIPINFNFR